MRQFASVVSFILACTGCVVAPEPQPLFSAVTSDVAPDDLHCRDYRALATVESQVWYSDWRMSYVGGRLLDPKGCCVAIRPGPR